MNDTTVLEWFTFHYTTADVEDETIYTLFC